MDLFALQTEISIGIEKAIDNLIKIGIKASEVADAIEKGIGGNNEADIDTKKAKKSLNDVEEAADDVSDSLNDVNDNGKKLGGLGSVIGGVGKGLATLGGIVTGVVGGFLALGETTREYREDMGKLETAFKSAGFETEVATNTYKEFFSVLGEEDRSVEAVNHLAKLTSSEEELAKWTDICAGVWGTFGDSLPIEGLTESANETAKVGQVTGVLADALNWAGMSEEEFNLQLANCNSEQERATLITNTLNGLYSEAADNYKEVNKDIIAAQKAQSDLTDTIARFGAIAEPIMTSFKIIVNEVLEGMLPFVGLIGEGLQGALNGSSEASKTLADGIGGLLDFLVERVTNMLPMILNIVLELVPSIVNTLLEALPQLLDIVLNLVIQIIDMLGELLPQIVTKVIEIVPMLIESIMNAFPLLLDAAINFFLAIVEAIPTIITMLLQELPSIIQTILDAITNAFPKLIQGAIQLLMAIVDAIPIIIDEIIKVFPTLINTIVNSVVEALPLLLEGAIQLFMAIVDAIPIIIDALIPEIPRIIDTIINTLLDNLPLLINASIQLFMGIVKAIPKILSSLVKSLGTIVSTIFDTLEDIDLLETGKEIIRGLIKGIGSVGGEIWKAVKNVGKSILDGFTDFFDIHSPSVLIHDKVGENVGLAVGEGVVDSTSKVLKNIDSFNNSVYDELGNFDNVGVSASPRTSYDYATNESVFNKLIDKLDSMEKAILSTRIYLNNDVLVGELIGEIDSSLGNLAESKERGN